MALTERFSASEQFALRWNNFSNNLSSGFLSHLNNKDLVDVTIAVEGQLLQAHKLVLSVCSTYFQDIFKANPCQHPVIILKDIGFNEVQALLQFMYQGEVNVKQDELASFLKVAETLQVKGLTLDKKSLKQDNGETTNSENDVDNNSRLSGDSVKHIEQEKLPKRRVTTSNATNAPKRSRSSLPPMLHAVDHSNNSPNANGSVDTEDEKHETSSHGSLMDQPDDDVIGNSSHSIDLTKEDEFNDDNLSANACEDKTNDQNTVQPVTYRLSAGGRPQLVHEGYVYNLTSRSEILNRSHYRCAEQHRGCRGKCAVIAERFMPTGVREHNHPPGYQSEHEYRKKKATEAAD